ncbi:MULTISPECIES: helix-turn-helix domain-containing protein [unclassified Sphingobacterium]|uniref:helix-turn-helix domain-containing protein n=1 Tax=unclassified Sphingobacterium TaxID=2609468 RepID=UPI0010467BC3|nr:MULTISPECIES: helix-turn-helix transcriptional regulator [unclassified Sphingobacterium]MCS3556790.1 transcriptional regulator with XRE-family HTH domain [Sphingobacterium sp. JUb21]TCQ99284.1 helix-turn-helix protein [Sphingobacterium sp. JUb20]
MANEEKHPYLELDNKKIGHKIYIQRKIAGLKAFDVAEQLDIKEAAYTKYERGETKITVDFIKKVADILKIDPLLLLSSPPDAFYSQITNSTILNASNFHNFHGNSEKQNESILLLIDNVIKLNDRMMTLLEKLDNKDI